MTSQNQDPNTSIQIDDAGNKDAELRARARREENLRVQRIALEKARDSNARFSESRKQRRIDKAGDSWRRDSFTLPRSEAQSKAREYLAKFPKAAYWSEVESWRELPGDVIEFTMRRLPSAD